MEYNTGKGGAWVDTDSIPDGTRAKFIDECVLQDSKFKNPDGSNKQQNVVKVRFENKPTALNANINWTSIYGLVAAFGKDSKNWTNQYLTVRARESMVGDKVRNVLYYVPEGFELVKDEEKKLVIRKIGSQVKSEVVEEPEMTEEDVADSIPF